MIQLKNLKSSINVINANNQAVVAKIYWNFFLSYCDPITWLLILSELLKTHMYFCMYVIKECKKHCIDLLEIALKQVFVYNWGVCSGKGLYVVESCII